MRDAFLESAGGARLILGYGAAERGDDGAGPMAARGLRQAGVEAEEFAGDGFALLERWRGFERVLIFDAAVTGAPPGTITVWDSAAIRPPAAALSSTHGFGLGEAIRMAQALGRIPPRLVVCGIEARSFDAGAPLSSDVAAAVESIVCELATAAGAWADKGRACRLREA
ncbi:MAG: hydrogenase maturation protease [Acidobacteria bacterium]|nr:hydrogenase maturation protease [Acidobacteriota bacterium]